MVWENSGLNVDEIGFLLFFGLFMLFRQDMYLHCSGCCSHIALFLPRSANNCREIMLNFKINELACFWINTIGLYCWLDFLNLIFRYFHIKVTPCFKPFIKFTNLLRATLAGPFLNAFYPEIWDLIWEHELTALLVTARSSNQRDTLFCIDRWLWECEISAYLWYSNAAFYHILLIFGGRQTVVFFILTRLLESGLKQQQIVSAN